MSTFYFWLSSVVVLYFSCIHLQAHTHTHSRFFWMFFGVRGLLIPYHYRHSSKPRFAVSVCLCVDCDDLPTVSHCTHRIDSSYKTDQFLDIFLKVIKISLKSGFLGLKGNPEKLKKSRILLRILLGLSFFFGVDPNCQPNFFYFHRKEKFSIYFSSPSKEKEIVIYFFFVACLCFSICFILLLFSCSGRANTWHKLWRRKTTTDCLLSSAAFTSNFHIVVFVVSSKTVPPIPSTASSSLFPNFFIQIDFQHLMNSSHTASCWAAKAKHG